MLNPIKKIALTALAVCWTLSLHAFTIIGPFDTYQTPGVDYDAPVSLYAIGGTSDLGGPQNLGEWYRWNTPRLYYAYDASFVDYFGSNGVRAVEQAVAVFNALPAVSQMSANLTEFAMDSRSQNPTAYALGLIDLKSVAMCEILGQMGSWNPTRFTWTPLAKSLPPGAVCPAYDVSVIMRNFDPITWNPSAYVNNQLYTFVLVDPCTPDTMDAVEQPVNPSSLPGSAVADEQTSVLTVPGIYYSGLTRDDVGGLRYLLSRRQVAVESLTSGAVLGGAGGTTLPSSIGATLNGAPWNLAVALSLTNSTVIGNPGSPWSIVIANSGTNSTNSIVITNTTGTTTTSNGGPFNIAGVEKITLIQVPFDSTIGINYTPFVDSYALTMYNDGQASSQTVTRTVAAPDVVFEAGNLGIYGIGTESVFPVMISRSSPGFLTTIPKTASHLNNGPGTINPSTAISFSDIGPWQTIDSGITVLGSQGLVTYWGSFDGTTNAPLVYPSGASIQQIESRLFP